MKRGLVSNATRYEHKPIVLETPTRLTNATHGRGPYVPPKWHTRAGSEAFLFVKSKGLGT